MQSYLWILRLLIFINNGINYLPTYITILFLFRCYCQLYQFKSFRVDFIEQMLVNGKALTPHQAVRTSIYAQHKP